MELIGIVHVCVHSHGPSAVQKWSHRSARRLGLRHGLDSQPFVARESRCGFPVRPGRLSTAGDPSVTVGTDEELSMHSQTTGSVEENGLPRGHFQGP